MKFKRLPIALLLLNLCIPFMARAQSKAPQLGQSPIPDIIKAMTLKQKVMLVVGKGFQVPGIPGLNPPGHYTTPKKNPTVAGHTISDATFGIPSIDMSDGPAGIHRYMMTKEDSANGRYATAWPVATLLASSWDTSLVKQVGRAFGKEVKNYGIDFILAPAANIQRNPLDGRDFEYYSEDPLLSGKMAAAIINGIQSQGVGATLKHFVANNQETHRTSLNEFISERALREIYLKDFKIAIQNSHPWAVMSSYNLVNGTYTSESHGLLTTILRKEWGFKGFVMTDWFGGKHPVAQMKAGNNLLMPGTQKQVTTIMNAVKSGKLSESTLDKNVEGILKVMLRTPTFKKFPYPNHVNLKKHAKLSRKAAAESMVLLKNSHQTLPIHNASKTVSLFGNHAYDLIADGTGSGNVNKKFAISLAKGLTNAGFKIDMNVQRRYVTYLKNYSEKHPKKPPMQEIMNPTPMASEYGIDKKSIDEAATHSDIAIVYIGRISGEGKDRKVKNDFDLTNQEKQMIDEVSSAFHKQHKPVIAVLNIAGVIKVTSFRNKVDAILLSWLPGEEGGNAMADVLTGKVDPSGKLPTTFPLSYKDEPSAKYFPGKSFPNKATKGMLGQKTVPGQVTYKEGIYVGYRYFNTFHVKPAYEFGYGLSYTKFSYSPVRLSSSTFNGKLTAKVTITNTGKVAGKDVVELYLSAPHGKLDKPSEELKGFAKTALLDPGKSQTITFTLNPADLASYDTDASSWIAAPGKYTVKIGASSLKIKSKATFNILKKMVVEKDQNVMMPHVKIHEMKN